MLIPSSPGRSRRGSLIPAPVFASRRHVPGPKPVARPLVQDERGLLGQAEPSCTRADHGTV